ncbi:MAG TPA: FmdB family zinc ribbon protein [Nocardioides sp.]|nr:FmdB family zinc ribbon protein [Nocardioides sp.]
MPTYQYACRECGHAFEQFQSFSDDALSECPECSGRLRKVFNAVGVVFKGSGFYRTDSRTPQKSETGSKSESSDSGSTKSETPAASKPKETASS